MRRLWGAACLLWAGAALAGPWPDIDQPPPALGGGENDAAVVVGIEDYVFLSDVPGAGRNATAWYEYLVRTRKVPVGRVALLLDRDGTNTRVRSAVAEAAAQVKPGGTLWFVFIGHGAPAKDGGDGLLAGVDAQTTEVDFASRSLSRRELLSALAKAKGARPVAVLDTCFSGLDRASQPLLPNTQFVVNPQALSAGLAGVAGVTVLSAGRPDEIAGPLPGEQRPAFSYLVLGALRGWGDGDGDGQVTAREAAEYAGSALRVLAKGRSQRPGVSGEDAPLTPKLPRSEAGPDLASLVVSLAGAAGALAPAVGDGFAKQLAELEQAARDREAAEARERALREQARQAHETQVDVDWRLLERFAGSAKGPEVLRAVEAFAGKYAGHPLGNPRAGDAAALLARLKRAQGPDGYVRIEPGSFRMGSPDDEQGRDSDERQHPVRLTRAFWLKKTEVTQREWKAVMGSAPWSFVACGDECPVERVNWYEAVAFLNALSRREGLPQCYELSGCQGTLGGGCRREDDPACDAYMCEGVRFVGPECAGYRLPTEAEWEYAARAGTTTALYTGPLEIRGEHDGPAIDPIAWYGGNSAASYDGAYGCSSWADKQFPATKCGPRPVGTKRANPWGLHDMLGSVQEWTEDAFGPYGDEAVDPLGREGGNRVARGGSWSSQASYVRAAFRLHSPPQSRSNAIGIRPARTIP